MARSLCLLCASVPLWLGCARIPVEDREERLVAWRLVEIDVAGGRELVFERAVRAGPRTLLRIEARLSRERAAVGEEVRVEIWLPEATGFTRLRIRPGRPGVKILGPDAFEVFGPEVVTVRFTCETAGRGGIVIVATER